VESNFSLRQSIHISSDVHPALCLETTGDAFPEHKAPPSVDIKNEWSYTSITHMYSWRVQRH